MTRKVSLKGMMFAAVMVIGTFAGSIPARAIDDCAPLAPPGGAVEWSHCYFIDVPEGVDMLRVGMFSGTGYAELSNPAGKNRCFLGWGGDPQYSCAVPGPAPGRWRLHVTSGEFSAFVQFAEAKPVTGAAFGAVLSRSEGEMFRFDGLEGAARIALASGSDLTLRVRRGAPPTFDDADCVSAQPSTRPIIHYYGYPVWEVREVEVTVAAGTEDCLLEAGAGSIYAFVSSFAATTTASAYVSTPPSPYSTGTGADPGCVRIPLGGCLPGGFAISGALNPSP